MYWLRFSIEQNEKRFDSNVFSAINDVAEMLDKVEEEESVDVWESEHFVIGQGNNRIYKPKFKNYYNDDKSSSILKDSIVNWLELNRFDNNQFRNYIRKYYNTIDLQERINMSYLDKMLAEELKSRNIRANYSYGIYSFEDSCFVIRDGHFTACAQAEGESTLLEFDKSTVASLVGSKYRTRLFRGEIGSPGELVIYFPSRRSIIWRDALKILLWSVLFMSIILICFIYTINVIIRQKKLSEMKNDFINNMTHEFKTPIATISLAVDSINSPVIAGKPDKVSRFAEIIKQENRRMLSQVEKVLQMAQIEKRDLHLKMTEVDVHELIEMAVQNFQLIVKGRSGHINLDLQANPFVIEADPTHLSNVVHNLLDNANKYSPDSPEINVHTYNDKEGIYIEVRDKGIGMSKDVLKHIFDKFYRVHTGNLHDVKGFGLGLSYVKAMTESHKGRVEVQSEPGKGSVFTLFFPFKQ
jgi:two-component system phosphate regulon sensor histidine kinase PhoR